MRQYVKRNANLFAGAFAFAFLLGLFGPIEFYCSNIYNVWYDLHVILPGICIVTVVIFAVVAAIGLILDGNGKARKIYEYVLGVLTICLYIQGTFVKMPYGEMNGETIDWSMYSSEDVQSVIIWLVFIVVAFLIYKKVKAEKLAFGMRIVTICISIIMAVSMVIIGVSSEGFARKKLTRPLDKNAFAYSSDKNMCILILDTFDARVFEDYALSENENRIEEEFADFTYYRDTMGMFTLTNYAVPHILTGEKFLGDIYYEDYIEKSYEDSPLLNRLKSENWNVRIHTDQVLPCGEGRELFDNVGTVTYKASDEGAMLKGVYQLVAFKYLPTVLKKYVYYPYEYLEMYKQAATIDGIDAELCDCDEDNWGNLEFYQNIAGADCNDEKCTCQIYHLKGLHALRNLDENMNYIQNSGEYYSLEQESGVVIDIVASWLQKMKSIGAYDNSIIVIMADHGAVEYETDDDNFAQCPLLMVKGYGEHHNFEISSAPLSYDDLQVLFGNLLDGEQSDVAVEETLGNIWKTESRNENFLLEELEDRRNEENFEVGRRRYMIFHKFSGNLGGKETGSVGYELYTDYPAYRGRRVQVSEKTY